jgi:hypothetical protein
MVEGGDPAISSPDRSADDDDNKTEDHLADTNDLC